MADPSERPRRFEGTCTRATVDRMTMTPPVLFLIFNRPDTTARVMEAIRAARCPRLYVAADGPRERTGEAERCAEARQLATAVDWPCQVQTLFRHQNLGIRTAVSSAIDWFFDHEEEGIILEDDCLPSGDFFQFCGELLPRFRSESRVMAVCGSCYTNSTFDMAESYYFSYYPDMWGWATWRRAWQLYDRDLSRWPKFKRAGGLRSVFDGDRWREAAWSTWFDLTAVGEIDGWDYQWIYTVIEQGGLACYPTRNLVSNLGYQAEATHTIVEVGGDPGPLACSAHQGMVFPLRHPRELARSEALERELEEVRLYYLKNWASESLKRRMLRRRLERILQLLPAPIRTPLTQLRAARVRWIKHLRGAYRTR
jgi:hypothetical protein